jgi:hypothetical protein
MIIIIFNGWFICMLVGMVNKLLINDTLLCVNLPVQLGLGLMKGWRRKAIPLNELFLWLLCCCD